MADDLTFANVQIPVSVDNKLRAIAAERRTSRSEVVRLAIQTFLQQYDVIAESVIPHTIRAQEVTLFHVREKEA